MSNLRISGLASGMDTDAMVQSLMKVERMKVNRYEQSKQVALWRQEAYNSMNKMFANFILNSRKDMGLTKVTSTGLALGNSYSNLDYIRKATSSNEAAATVSSTSKAVNGSYTIEVDKLATSGSFASAYMKDETDKLVDGMTFTLKGTEIIVNKSGETVTMDDVIKAINAKKDDTKITAFYDATNGRVFMQTMETGENQNIELVGTNLAGTNFISALTNENTKTIDTITYDGAKKTAGQNAEITFNGVKLTYSSNSINLNGLNIQLKSEGVSTTINVDTNVDGIMEKVEKLINDYNELVDKASKALNEKRYTSYHPLSMEEKKAMHEDDAKLWEEKAKSGMLNRDETIQRALQNARNGLYKTVEGVSDRFNHITKIGISTEKYSRGTTGGKLQIDTDKLKEAIMEDPEAVMELLFKEGKYKAEKDSNGNPIEDIIGDRGNYTTKGIFTGIYDSLTDGMKSIIDKSGPGEDSDLFRNVKSNILLDFVTKKSSISDIDKEVLDANKRIDDLNAMLYRKENAYYAKFANMEKMLQQMNSQSSWLAQQFMR